MIMRVKPGTEFRSDGVLWTVTREREDGRWEAVDSVGLIHLFEPQEILSIRRRAALHREKAGEQCLT